MKINKKEGIIVQIISKKWFSLNIKKLILLVRINLIMYRIQIIIIIMIIIEWSWKKIICSISGELALLKKIEFQKDKFIRI